MQQSYQFLIFIFTVLTELFKHTKVKTQNNVLYKAAA